MRTIVWFRGKELRIADHAPLQAALHGGEVIPLFVLDPYFFAPERARELSNRLQFLLSSLKDEPGWNAWTAGTTGYPVVDAAARQLLGEGFVHNRARMITASFLTKHLLIDYRRGEAHYMKHLTDGDWAQNNAGWQWSAGSGCDAQPYFRIFNPVTQGETFDPDGEYVRRWVPELAKMPATFIHKPWEAPAAVLQGAGVELGHTYPRPIVEHRTARERFLAVAKSHLQTPTAATTAAHRDGAGESMESS